jgi:hypothetical protein
MNHAAIIRYLLHTWFLSLLFTTTLQAQQYKRSPAIPENFCISANEFILAKMINDYRRQNNLAVIPFSKSMFFVGRSHVQDLSQNHPDGDKCGLQSWSDKGNWKPCCYNKEEEKTSCMYNKPKELAGYKGKGYEMIYWGNEAVVPSEALEVWKSTVLTNEMMLNLGKWKSKIWKSIGVGLLEGYATVWFGDGKDQYHGVLLCQNDSILDSQNEISLTSTMPAIETGQSENHYFLITGSFKTRKQAEVQVASHIKQGFHKATVIEKDKVFRIAISSYSSQEEAQKALNMLTTRFKGIWILQY